MWRVTRALSFFFFFLPFFGPFSEWSNKVDWNKFRGLKSHFVSFGQKANTRVLQETRGVIGIILPFPFEFFFYYYKCILDTLL